jgi:hypothetical protein
MTLIGIIEGIICIILGIFGTVFLIGMLAGTSCIDDGFSKNKYFQIIVAIISFALCGFGTILIVS